jgi:hypothetical protein
MKWLLLSVSLLQACGGDAIFRCVDECKATVSQGESATFDVVFAAEGGWTGEYEFYLDFHDRSDVLSGSVSPASATVDGEVSLTVTVEASESAPIGQNDAFGIYAERTSGGILQEINGYVDVVEADSAD